MNFPLCRIDWQLLSCCAVIKTMRSKLGAVRRSLSSFAPPTFVLDGRFESHYQQPLRDWILLSDKASADDPDKRTYALKQLLQDLNKNHEAVKELQDLQRQADSDSSKDSAVMMDLIRTELGELTTQRHSIEAQMCQEFYLAQEKNAQVDEITTCQMEIASGAGGQEAMLFAAELHNMYKNFAQYSNWTFNTLKFADDTSYAGKTGIRSSLSEIQGLNAFAKLRFEAGIHRVQRVPLTESHGRIHTSTVSVAVLPKPVEINIEINPTDIKVQTMRASGAGGMHVNTTDSAVRIVHVPTGVAVESQQERSQVDNRAAAMRRLRQILYQREYEERMNQYSSERKVQIGTKDRSLKIRTYHFPRDMVTDHRIKFSMLRMSRFLQGGEDLDLMINKLTEADVEEYFESLVSRQNISDARRE